MTQSKKRQPGTPVEFAGWICGDEEDRETLRDLGVSGGMIWKESDNCQGETGMFEYQGKTGMFEYCTITLDMVDRLMEEYPPFWPGCFTGLREDGEQTLDQPLWKLGHDISVKRTEEKRYIAYKADDLVVYEDEMDEIIRGRLEVEWKLHQDRLEKEAALFEKKSKDAWDDFFLRQKVRQGDT